MKKIIGMIGKAGSGKDTVGTYICNKYNFKQMALADPLKASIKEMFCLKHEEVYDRIKREEPILIWPEWSVRKLFQFIGTDLMRNQFDREIWVKILNKRILESDHSRIVVTDFRFPNEQEYIKKHAEEYGYKIHFIKVIRDGYIGVDVGIENHESELYDLEADYVVENNSSLEDLYIKVNEIIKDIVEV